MNEKKIIESYLNNKRWRERKMKYMMAERYISTLSWRIPHVTTILCGCVYICVCVTFLDLNCIQQVCVCAGVADSFSGNTTHNKYKQISSILGWFGWMHLPESRMNLWYTVLCIPCLSSTVYLLLKLCMECVIVRDLFIRSRHAQV